MDLKQISTEPGDPDCQTPLKSMIKSSKVCKVFISRGQSLNVVIKISNM